MNNLIYFFLSVVSGSLILIQNSLNGSLSRHLNSPIFSSFCLYFFSTVFLGIIIFIFQIQIPKWGFVKNIPAYLFFLGSVLSCLGLTLVYFLMPKLGVAKVMSGILTGQVVSSVIVSHYGCFDLPVNELTSTRAGGVLILILGSFLVNWESM